MAACTLLHSRGRVASSWQGNRHAVCRAFSPRQQQFNSVRRQLLTSGVLLASTTAASAVASKQPALAYADRQLTSATNQPWDGDISSLQSSQDPPTIVTAPGRMVAIGDLHGDWDKTVRSLVLAGVLSVNRRSYKWVGGDTVVVQLGDVLDRGTSEIAIMLLLRELDQQARKDGGAVYMLNGNHESLNICQNYSYVDVLALAETIAYCELFEAGQEITVDTLMAATAEKIPEINPYDRNLVKYQFQRYRSALFQPGGPLARLLSVNPTVLMVNDTVFAHGGVLPVHVNYGLDKLNAEVAAWMRGDRTQDGGFAAPPFLAMGGSNSVMWTRMMSTERQSEPQRFHAKSLLKTALARLGAERLVVGHTPQVAGINADLDDKVWRVDVGMSSGVLDAPVQVLEILPRAGGEEEISVLMEGMPLRSFDELGVEVDI